MFKQSICRADPQILAVNMTCRFTAYRHPYPQSLPIDPAFRYRPSFSKP